MKSLSLGLGVFGSSSLFIYEGRGEIFTGRHSCKWNRGYTCFDNVENGTTTLIVEENVSIGSTGKRG